MDSITFVREPQPAVAVLGSSGFVGTAVVAALEEVGASVLRLKAPRLPAVEPGRGAALLAEQTSCIQHLSQRLTPCHAVVNAAGIADAQGNDVGPITAANAVLPGVIGAAARHAGVARYIHISSAAVQGDHPVLDDSWDGTARSPYALAKRLGEQLALVNGPDSTVIYRPPGVHGPGREVTRRLSSYARSPIAFIASDGQQPTPQAHISDVASAVAFLTLYHRNIPPVVSHPWGGMTTSSLLLALGRRQPRLAPKMACHGLVAIGGLRPPRHSAGYATRRRLQVLLFGQPQSTSWLTEAGWTGTATVTDWQALGDHIASNPARP